MSCQNKEIQLKITTNISFSARPETISLKNNIHPLAFRGPVFNAGVFQNVIKSEKKTFFKKKWQGRGEMVEIYLPVYFPCIPSRNCGDISPRKITCI